MIRYFFIVRNIFQMDLEMGYGKDKEIMNINASQNYVHQSGLLNRQETLGEPRLAHSTAHPCTHHVQSTTRRQSSNSHAIYVFCCLLIFALPFPICEFYYAFTSITCQNVLVTEALNVTLKEWLLVDANFHLVELMLIYVALRSNLVESCFLCKWIGLSFGLAWNIVGGFLFWKYLLPTHTCGSSLENFMWIRLILGLVTSFKQVMTTNSST